MLRIADDGCVPNPQISDVTREFPLLHGRESTIPPRQNRSFADRKSSRDAFGLGGFLRTVAY